MKNLKFERLNIVEMLCVILIGIALVISILRREHDAVLTLAGGLVGYAGKALNNGGG